VGLQTLAMQVDLPKGGHAKNMLKNDEVGVHGG